MTSVMLWLLTNPIIATNIYDNVADVSILMCYIRRVKTYIWVFEIFLHSYKTQNKIRKEIKNFTVLKMELFINAANILWNIITRVNKSKTVGGIKSSVGCRTKYLINNMATIAS